MSWRVALCFIAAALIAVAIFALTRSDDAPDATPTDAERLAASLERAVATNLKEDGAYSMETRRGAEKCEALEGGADFNCRVQIYADLGALKAVRDLVVTGQPSGGPSGEYGLFTERYDLEVGEDGCWTATQTKWLMGGEPSSPEVFTGCVSGLEGDYGADDADVSTGVTNPPPTPTEDEDPQVGGDGVAPGALNAGGSGEVLCESIVITPNTDDGIFNITARGLSCEEAREVLTDWGEDGYAGEGPEGYSCADAARLPDVAQGDSTGSYCARDGDGAEIRFGGYDPGRDGSGALIVDTQPSGSGGCSDFDFNEWTITDIKPEQVSCDIAAVIITRFVEDMSPQTKVGDGWICDNYGASGPLVCESAIDGRIYFHASS